MESTGQGNDLEEGDQVTEVGINVSGCVFLVVAGP